MKKRILSPRAQKLHFGANIRDPQSMLTLVRMLCLKSHFPSFGCSALRLGNIRQCETIYIYMKIYTFTKNDLFFIVYLSIYT